MSFNETMGLLKLRDALAGAVYNAALKPTPETLRGLPYTVSALADGTDRKGSGAAYLKREMAIRRGASQELADEAAFWCALALGAVDALIQNSDTPDVRLAHARNLLMREAEKRNASCDAAGIDSCLAGLVAIVEAHLDAQSRAGRKPPLHGLGNSGCPDNGGRAAQAVEEAFAATMKAGPDGLATAMSEALAKSTGIGPGELQEGLDALADACRYVLRSGPSEASRDALAMLERARSMVEAEWA